MAFGPLKVESTDNGYRFDVIVYLGDLEPDAVRVELFANPRNNSQDKDEPFRMTMNRGATQADGGCLYSVTISSTRSANDFTPRVAPYHSGASVPLEATQILWQK